MKKKWIILIICITSIIIFLVYDILTYKKYIDAFSGATPLAIKKSIPENLRLKVNGKVKQEYVFTSRSFKLLADIRIRTKEVAPDGNILGTYIYHGIPLYNIMESISPKKSIKDAFDRPLDMIVIFTSSSKKKVSFSYGELTMGDDSNPITLAYYREALLPSKKHETYKGNKRKGKIKGLCLICPGDYDTARYLEDIKTITLSTLPTPDKLLPVLSKGKKCISKEVVCISNKQTFPANYKNIETLLYSKWFRTGHGLGIKGQHTKKTSGYKLSTFLKNNFATYKPNDYYMFVACDGYRVLLSGREIFMTDKGQSYILINSINNKSLAGSISLGPITDFFIDRNLRNLSHIIKLTQN